MNSLRAALSMGLLWLLTACASKERPDTIRLDYATYNPVSLLLKEKGYLEQALAEEGIKVEWVKSLGSNKALEFLNAKSVDLGSTAGAAALVAKANGNPIQSIYVYSKPEWTALVTRPDTNIKSVADLKGKKIAVTRGTDPFIFLLRALDSAGLSEKDVELVQLQHPDGQAALERGDVDAWAGLDPLMATSEQRGSVLFLRKPEWNTYGVLNVREEFAKRYPNYVARVLKAYEKARAYALEHPEELEAALIREAKLDDAVAKAVLARTDITSPAIGDVQKQAILPAGDVLKKSHVIKADVDVKGLVDALVDPSFSQALAQE